jgi:hypothetical protein
VVEVPTVSRLLKPAHTQLSSSQSVPSPVSDDGGNAARIALLESRVASLEAEHVKLAKEVRALHQKMEKMDA